MCNANGYDLSLQIKVLSHLALASTTRHGHSFQNARYVQFVKEHATGFSARAFQIFVCASHNPRPCWNVQPGMAGLLRRDPHTGGACRDRTDDPLLAKQVLSQLSYGPKGQSP